MTRRPPADAPDPAVLRPSREPFLEAEIHLVTPMFGGGAAPGEPDQDNPVRGPGVRGQLRFWWRACNAARFATAAELFQAEAAIWGQSANKDNARKAPSAVDVSVATLDRGRLSPCAEPEFTPRGIYRARWLVRRPPGSIPYALWPFQGQGAGGKVSQPPNQMREGLKFRLSFTLAAHAPDARAEGLRREVLAALWAWVSFGGLGARTRRGCGALYSPMFSASGDIVPALRRTAEQHIAPGSRRLQIPSLHGATVVVGQPDAPLEAWNCAVGWLQSFRQGVGFARNPGQSTGNLPPRPGRSRWPEPDSVRQLLDLYDPRHPPVHPARPLFPRADLGLPILFQQMAGGTHTLQADAEVEGATRFASPVVIKPLSVGPTRALPMLLVFDAPHLWEIAGAVLDGRPIPPTQLNDPAKSATVAPLGGHQNAREALLARVRGQSGVRAVTL